MTGERTDTELMDFLQKMVDQKRYTGEVILRWSTEDRGMRLHETQSWDATGNVREAINRFIDDEERG